MKVAKFEVYKIRGDHKETRQRWHALADQVQQITNCIWETWLCWHVANRSGDAQRDFLDRHAAWKVDKTLAKPKCAITAIPKALDKIIYDTLGREFPRVNATTRELVRKCVCDGIRSRKASQGNLPGWVSIILRNESIPSSTRSQPIPFSKKNATILAPEQDGERFTMRLRLDRTPRAGKSGISTLDHVELLTNRRGIRQHETTLRKIVSGQFKFCGSKLLWHRHEKKWFVLICYDQPEAEKAVLDVKRRAVLHPGRHDPWMLWSGGRSQWLGGTGRYVAATRQRLLTSRWSRQENYRHAGSSTKGHGRERALLAIEQLAQGWKNFVKTCNHRITAEAVRRCVLDGCGVLVYLQPVDAKRDSRFLTMAGKIPGRRDPTGWDWAQVAAMLSYKCAEAGIKLEIRKCGEAAPTKTAA